MSTVTTSPLDLTLAFRHVDAPAGMPADPAPDHAVIGVNEIAEMTGMSVRWVYETFTVLVPPMKFGNRSRWYRWQVLAWIDAQHRAAAR